MNDQELRVAVVANAIGHVLFAPLDSNESVEVDGETTALLTRAAERAVKHLDHWDYLQAVKELRKVDINPQQYEAHRKDLVREMYKEMFDAPPEIK